MRIFYNRVNLKELVASRRLTKERREEAKEGVLGKW